MTLKISTTDSDGTEKIGQLLGKHLKGGEVIELISDLGGGKTTLVRGIAQGAGSKDKVASPTFTVSKEYTSGNLRIVHYDFYRLQDPGLMQYELAETLSDPKSVAIIEWADIVHDVLPAERVTVNIKSTGDIERQLDIVIPDGLSYLFPQTDKQLEEMKEQK